MTLHVGVLVPLRADGPRGTPEQMPLGRVALHLASDDIVLVFGQRAQDGCVTGFVAREGSWEPVRAVPVVGAYDRYPSKKDPAGHADLAEGLMGLPLVNPTSLTLLCRDKLACQRRLEASGLPLPPVVEAARAQAALVEWGAAFVKPRHGAFGTGIRRLVTGDPVPAEVPGAVDGAPEPTILQRAVPPPAGWAGVSVRVLVQRGADGAWTTNPAVARRHRTDPVVNVARGAETAPAADVLGAQTLEAVHTLGLHAARALASHPDGTWLAEIGVDLAVHADGAPWILEVNSRPRGRLEALAEADPARFARAHLDACARPLRFVAAAAESATRGRGA